MMTVIPFSYAVIAVEVSRVLAVQDIQLEYYNVTRECTVLFQLKTTDGHGG